MAIMFDGRAFANKKEDFLKKQGEHPKLISILVGNDQASRLYVSLKKKFADRVGAVMEIKEFPENAKEEEIANFIKQQNSDKSVDGIMVQLPLPGGLKDKTTKIINVIAKEKDIDGLREDSPYLHPTSKAVVQIIKESGKLSGSVCVVGATGMVGKPLVHDLRERGYQVVECDSGTINLKEETLRADIVVSATGVPGLIKEDMIKDGAIVIDVGSPKGDVDFENVSKKASFITPVPGGVGPVTIACLLENLFSTCTQND